MLAKDKMTRIKGSLERVKEVLKKGYTQPIIQTTRGYTITTGAIAVGVHTYNLPGITAGKKGYVKKISATCNDATSIHEVYLTRNNVSPVSTLIFSRNYFSVGYEWTIIDVTLEDTSTWTVTIDNNAAGVVSFTINVYWIESSNS